MPTQWDTPPQLNISVISYMQRELLMGEVILRGGFRPSTADSLNRALSPELNSL